MKSKKWIYLGLAATLIMLIAATALYADPITPFVNQGNDGASWLSQGNGNRDGNGKQQRRGKRGGKRNGNRGNGNRGGRCFTGDFLNLTEDQKDDIKIIFEEHKDMIEPLRENFRDARWDFRDAMRGDEVDANAIRDAADTMADYGAEMALEMAEVRTEIKGLLTDEQLEKIEEGRDNVRGFLEGFGNRIDRRLEASKPE